MRLVGLEPTDLLLRRGGLIEAQPTRRPTHLGIEFLLDVIHQLRLACHLVSNEAHNRRGHSALTGRSRCERGVPTPLEPTTATWICVPGGTLGDPKPLPMAPLPRRVPHARRAERHTEGCCADFRTSLRPPGGASAH